LGYLGIHCIAPSHVVGPCCRASRNSKKQRIADPTGRKVSGGRVGTTHAGHALREVAKNDSRVHALEELDDGPGTLLDAPSLVLSWMRVMHLTVLPLQEGLSLPLARYVIQRLLAVDPNDGGGSLLGDLHRFPDEIYSLHHADHYLRPQKTCLNCSRKCSPQFPLTISSEI
jgi:hypothetical protein